MLLYTAFILGFLGSFHCVGMCGPIALSLPLSTRSNTARWLGHFTYQFGKILAYVFLGLIIGTVGKGISLLGIQNWYTILLGITLLIIGLGSISKRFNVLFWLEQKMAFFKGNLGGFFAKSTFSTLFTIGFLNGLLPCGLVYVAILGASALGDIGSSMLYMFLFGLGVAPALIMLSVFGHFATVKWRSIFKNIYPYVSILLGIMLLARGIYFMQPSHNSPLDNTNISVPMCGDHQYITPK